MQGLLLTIILLQWFFLINDNSDLVIIFCHLIEGLWLQIFQLLLPPSASVGLAWVSAGVDKIDGRNARRSEHTQYLSTSENAFIISFAQRILPWFSAGLNVKILNHQLPMNTMDIAGKGMGMDFGVFIHSERWTKPSIYDSRFKF